MFEWFFYDLSQGNVFTWVIAILVLTLLALLAWLITSFVYYLFDVVGVSVKEGRAKILQKTTRAPYTTYALIGTVLVPTFHPRAYYLHVDIIGVNEKEAMGSFSKKTWDAAEVGQTIGVHYKIGRHSNEAYLEAVSL